MKQREAAKSKTSPSYIVLTAILMIVAVVQIFPFYWMLTFSLKSNNEIYGGNIAGLPKTLHFENYVKAFSTGNIGVYLKNSIIVTVVTIIFVSLLACMAAYAMLRMEWKFQKSVFGLFLIGYMIPMHATLLPLMKLLGKIGLLNSRLALILPSVCNIHHVRLYPYDPPRVGGSSMPGRLQHFSDIFPHYYSSVKASYINSCNFYISERLERTDVGNDFCQ